MKTRKGFTIVELVVVIAVVAILAAVLIPSFSGVVEKTDRSTALKLAEAAYKEAKAQALEDGGIEPNEVVEANGFVFVFGTGSGDIVFKYPSDFAYDVEINGTEVELGAKRENNDNPDGDYENTTPATGVTLHRNSVTLEVGQTEILYAAVQPANAMATTVEWEVTGDTGAIEFSNGHIRAVAQGSAIIRAKVKKSDNTYAYSEKSCTVTVNPVSVNFVSLNSLNLSFTMGDVGRQLTATVKPDNAADKTVVWMSDDSNIVSVEDGLVVPNAPGYTIVKAIAVDSGKYAQCGVAVNGIKLSISQTTVNEGDSFAITAKAYPIDVKDLAWTSDRSNVAEVHNGVVVAKSKGTAVIAAKHEEFSAYCIVNVEEGGGGLPDPIIPDTPRIGLTTSAVSLKVDEEITIETQPVPDGYAVEWRCSDSNLADVDDTGKIYAKSAGTVTITAVLKDAASREVDAADCVVKITDTDYEPEIKSIAISGAISVIQDNSIDMEAAVVAKDGVSYNIEWKSSDEAVAVVDANGKVTGKSSGVVKITAVVKIDDVEKLSATYKVKVYGVFSVDAEYTAGHVVFGGDSTVIEGDKYVAILAPNTDYEIIDIDVTVGGVVVDISYDSAEKKIIIPDVSGNVAIEVTTIKTTPVVIPVEGVALNETELGMEVGKTTTLRAIVAPAGANDAVTWMSTNTNVATVSAAGEITAKSAGTTQIVVTTVDGGYKAICNVTVTGNELIEISIPDVEVNVGETVTIVPTFTPADATNTNVVWKSFNPAVATVDSNGVVTGHSVGTAIITAMSIDGGDIGGACTVTVTASSDVGGGAGSGDVTDSDDVESKTIVDVIVADESIQYIEVANPSEAFAGENYNLIVNAKDGYIITDIVVKDNGHPVGSPASYSQTQTFELGNIVGPITITATVTENLLKTSNGAGEAGYIEHSYLDSGGNAALLEGVFLSGYIDVRYVNSVNIINIDLNSSSTEPKRECYRIAFYDDSFNPLANCCYMLCEWLSHQSDIQFIYENENMVGFAKKGKTQNAAYFRISSAQIGEDSVIYAN